MFSLKSSVKLFFLTLENVSSSSALINLQGKILLCELSSEVILASRVK